MNRAVRCIVVTGAGKRHSAAAAMSKTSTKRRPDQDLLKELTTYRGTVCGWRARPNPSSWRSMVAAGGA
jgi:hypothetical protein